MCPFLIVHIKIMCSIYIIKNIKNGFKQLTQLNQKQL